MQMDWMSAELQRLIEDGDVILAEGYDGELAAGYDGEDQISEDEYEGADINKATRRGGLGHSGRPSSATRNNDNTRSFGP